MYMLTDREKAPQHQRDDGRLPMFPSYIRVGGLREDLPYGFHEAVAEFLDYFPPKIDEYERLLTKNQIWLKRTKNVGIISRGGSHPIRPGRPDGARHRRAYDVRKRFPYLGYETYDFTFPTSTNGDVYDRYLVRIAEMRESVKICRQALARITPRGDFDIKDYRIVPPPKDKVYSEMEALIQHFLIYSQGFTVPAGEPTCRSEGRAASTASTSCRTARTAPTGSRCGRRRSTRARRCRR
jgi:NADH-quinone oxidoreductase subunit D